MNKTEFYRKNITINGKPIKKKNFKWDKDNRILLCYEYGVEITANIEDMTIYVGKLAKIKTGFGADISTGGSCQIDGGDYSTISTGAECIINAGKGSIIDVLSDSEITVGGDSIIRVTGSNVKINCKGDNVAIINHVNFAIIIGKNGDVIELGDMDDKTYKRNGVLNNE